MARKKSKADIVAGLIDGAIIRSSDMRSRADLCKYMPFDETGLSRRISGETKFKVFELCSLKRILKWDSGEVDRFIENAL